MRLFAVILAALVIYSAGIVTGGLVVKNRNAPEPRHQRWSNQGPPPGMLDRVLTRMDRELDLAPDQRDKVKAIIAESKEKIRTVTQTVDPVVKEAFTTMRTQIKDVLNEKQQAQFERLFKGPRMGPPRSGRGGRYPRGPEGGPNFERRRRQPPMEMPEQLPQQPPPAETQPQAQEANQI